MITYQESLCAADLERAINCSLAFLRSHFRSIDGTTDCGWYHYLDDPSPGVTASAVGLYCFALAEQHFEQTDAVVDYLVASQTTMDQAMQFDVRDPELLVGGWSVRTFHGFPILEATAWVVRALSHPNSRPGQHVDAIAGGTAWLHRNQNADHGWGSHRGEESRVFHTSLALMALRESGSGGADVVRGARWLTDAMDPHEGAWGPTKGAKPTILHTALAASALSQIPDAASANILAQGVLWMEDRLEPGRFTEKASENEEFSVRVPQPGGVHVFDNSLPHFGGVLGLEAVLRLSSAPLKRELVAGAKRVMEAQSDDGTWELPRNPARPSIWAIWPFLAALTQARRLYVPTRDSNFYLLFDGVALHESGVPPGGLTVPRLMRENIRLWLRQHARRIALWGLSIAFALATLVTYAVGALTTRDLLLSMVVPLVFLLIDRLLQRRQTSA